MQISLDELHDAVLVAMNIDWQERRATLHLRSGRGPATLLVEDLASFAASRRDPWGRS
jgi:hypothetical protein